MTERLGRGVSVSTISAELAQKHRMESMGYGRPPGPSTLESHLRKHTQRLAPVSTNLPTFSGDATVAPVGPVYDPKKDIAAAIQEQALAQLQSGDMRINAAAALRAQELLDRRAEKAADRELQVALARIILARTVPSHLVGGEHAGRTVIEGEFTEEEVSPS